jgi:hypothetical protein
LQLSNTRTPIKNALDVNDQKKTGLTLPILMIDITPKASKADGGSSNIKTTVSKYKVNAEFREESLEYRAGLFWQKYRIVAEENQVLLKDK